MLKQQNTTKKYKLNKKAQAAMEFMLTYGWMLLVIVGVIGALVYFGALSHNRVVPVMCILEPGIACIDFKITPTTSTVVLLNGISDFEIVKAVVGDCSNQFSDLEIISGQKQTIILDNCDNGRISSKFKEVIKITRKDSQTGLERTHEGDITGLVE